METVDQPASRITGAVCLKCGKNFKAPNGWYNKHVAHCGGANGAAKSKKVVAPPKSETPPPVTIDEALGVLCDVLVLRLRGVLDARLETMLAQRVATAAIKLAPASPKPAALDKPETLDDETLRIEIIKARAQGELKRWTKLVAVMRKRSEAVNSVEFHSKEE